MGTFRQIYLHIVFGTKYRQPTIVEEHEKALYKYIWGVINGHKCHLYRINGMEDHLHILSDLHPSVCLADYVKDIKVSSSIWMKASGLFPDFIGWQSGYGAFSVNHYGKNNVINYIINQKQHHFIETFEKEYKRLLKEHEIEFDERYLFD